MILITLTSHFIILFLTLLPPNQVSSSPIEGNLINTLLSNYNKLTRPVPGEDCPPLLVNIGISINQIISVDEKRQILATNIQLRLQWTDVTLTWNASEHGNIPSVRIPINLLWCPDIILLNMADEDVFQSNENRGRLNAVIDNGTVTFISPMIVKTICKLDVTWFPFDSQRCHINFGSWAYSSSEVDVQLMSGELSGGTEAIDVEGYLPNGEWRLVNVSAERMEKFYSGYDAAYLTIRYGIELKRQSMYYFFNLIVPSALIGFLAVLGFTLPPDSGEKLSLGVTVLFSLIVFLNMIAQSMPSNSDGVPLLGTYFNCVMFMIACSVVSTIVVNLNLRGRKEPKEIDSFWQKVCLHWLPRLLRMERDEECAKVEVKSGIVSTLQMKAGNRNMDQVFEDDGGKVLRRKWMLVAVVVDRLCLIVSMFFMLISIVTFLVSNYL